MDIHQVSVAFLALVLPALAQAPVAPPGPLPSTRLGFEDRRDPGGSADFVARGPGFGLHIAATRTIARLRARDDSVAVVRCDLVDGDPDSLATPARPLPSKVHYLLGNDPAHWRRDVGLWECVTYADVWPGIDVVYHGDRGELEYDFVVAPGVDPAPIRLRFGGVDGLDVDTSGDLLLRVGGRTIHQRRPIAWQDIDGERRPVAAAFVVEDDEIAFSLGEHDPDHELVIDPILVYSSYFGGSGAEQFTRIATDNAGHAYIVGQTSSTDLATAQPAQGIHGGGGIDVFVTKFAADGSTILFSTYLGGVSSDIPGGISVAADGSIAVTGYTQSVNFPVQGEFQSSLAGNVDTFLTVFAPDGSLTYSTYFGGGSADQGQAIGWDSIGVLAIAGETSSIDLPLRSSPYQATKGNSTDVFVAKFDTRLSGPPSLQSSTYLGADGVEEPWDLVFNASRNVCLVGRTTSAQFPVVNGFQAMRMGNHDAFVAVLSTSLSSLLYSTYLGGSGNELFANAYFQAGIANDTQQRLVVTGTTTSADFPTTPGVLSRTLAGASDAFVTKIDPFPSGSSLVWSTYLGGSGSDGGLDVAMLPDDCVAVGGFSSSPDFPLPHALHPAPPSRLQAMVSVLSADGSRVLFGNTMGLVGLPKVSGIAVHDGRGLLLTGAPGSSNSFPITPGAFQQQRNNADVFVMRIDVTRATAESYGVGTPGTLGIPTLTASTPPELGTTITLDFSNSLGAPTLAVLVIGLQPAALPILGGTLLVVPTATVAVNIGPAGGSLPFQVPVSSAFSGTELFNQIVEVDAGAVGGISLSRGLRLTLGI